MEENKQVPVRTVRVPLRTSCVVPSTIIPNHVQPNNTKQHFPKKKKSNRFKSNSLSPATKPERGAGGVIQNENDSDKSVGHQPPKRRVSFVLTQPSDNVDNFMPSSDPLRSVTPLQNLQSLGLLVLLVWWRNNPTSLTFSLDIKKKTHVGRKYTRWLSPPHWVFRGQVGSKCSRAW